jgi:signal transduction histidine kinase
LQDVIKTVFEQLHIVAQNSQRELTLNIDENLQPMDIDYDIVQRMVSNLVSNAIKHTRKGGKIIIHTTDKPKEVIVCVEDNGEGIPQEYHEKIFEKFSQVKGEKYNNTHNVGLGLTFCKMAVEEHKGKIWVESELEKGSNFYFSLPKIKKS